jgi:hypothetical protein
MITPELTNSIAQQLQQQGINDQVINQLRQNYPGIHFTYCLDDEINTQSQPILEHSQFNLYLVDGRHHCFSLTTDYQAATGIVIAEVE